MIKLVIFDLDGVLVETKQIHFDSLNIALGEKFKISWDEHLAIYDGLKTSQKLEILHERKKLSKDQFTSIWKKKQEITLSLLDQIKPNYKVIKVLKKLKGDGYKVALGSNSIRKTVDKILRKLEVFDFFDMIISNEDVENSKPHPEMYWTIISKMKYLPEQTLIVEDSPHGLLAASRSNSHVLRVQSSNEINLDNIYNKINQIKMKNENKTPAWTDKKLNVLIPMAGAGSRFEKAGYTFPKPLIEVNGKPMIQIVIENLNIEANFIFIVQKAHRERYNLDALLNLLTPNCKIVEVDGITEGAACTALFAKEYINNDSPLFFSNSDQFVKWDSNEFFYKMNESNVDGGIVTFNATHPKWSFAKLDASGYVTEVAEKNPISDIATVGFYYWKKGQDFVKYAEQMIKKNIRVNNEFYVCPVFNEAIGDRKKITTFNVQNMWGLGTPEDLDNYLKQNK